MQRLREATNAFRERVQNNKESDQTIKRTQTMLLVTVLIGLVVMLVFTAKDLRDWTGFQLPWLASWAVEHPQLAHSLFDALIWQWAAAILYFVIRYRAMAADPKIKAEDRRPLARRRILIRVAACVLSVLAFSALWTYLLQHSIMEIVDPPVGFGEGYATRGFYWFLRQLGFSRMIDSTGPGAASGFVVCQTLLIMAYAKHVGDYKERHDRVQWPQLAVFIALSLLVLASRLIIGEHTMRDVGLAVGLGIFGYWIGMTVRIAFWQLKTDSIQELILPLGSYLLVGQFFCHSPVAWIILGLVVVIVLFAAFLCVGYARKGLTE